MSITLCLVSSFLGGDFYKISVYKFEATETKVSYSFKTNRNRRVNKNLIGHIQSNLVNDHSAIGFYSYCLESDVESTITKIKSAIETRLEEVTSSVEKMNTSFNKGAVYFLENQTV